MPEYHFAAEQSVILRELSKALSVVENEVTQLNQTVHKLERRAESHQAESQRSAFPLIAKRCAELRGEQSGSTAATKKRPNDSPDLAEARAHPRTQNNRAAVGGGWQWQQPTMATPTIS